MKKILIVTSQEKKFAGFMDALVRNGAEVIRADSAEAAVDSVSAAKPNLVVIDETVDGIPGLKIARSILMKNAMVNQAVVSPLSPDDFHEASEGLGIMAQLSPSPDAAQAKMILELLGKMP